MEYLSEMCRRGDIENVKFLVENGANVTAYDNFAVRLASMNGHLVVVKFLVENGADVTADDNFAVRLASYAGHLDVVKFLVENGADVTVRDNFAVRSAYKRRNMDVVEYLLSLYTHENIHTLKGKISKKLYKEEVTKLEILKEQKRQVTDMIYCSPDLLPKSNTRVMGYNVILGLELVMLELPETN